MFTISFALLLGASIILLFVSIRLALTLRSVKQRLTILSGLLAPAKAGRKNPEMRIAIGRAYLFNINTWLNRRLLRRK